jgi:hypothetical protein
LNFFNKTLKQRQTTARNKSVIQVKLQILFSKTEKTEQANSFFFRFCFTFPPVSLSLSVSHTGTDTHKVCLSETTLTLRDYLRKCGFVVCFLKVFLEKKKKKKLVFVSQHFRVEIPACYSSYGFGLPE